MQRRILYRLTIYRKYMSNCLLLRVKMLMIKEENSIENVFLIDAFFFRDNFTNKLDSSERLMKA